MSAPSPSLRAQALEVYAMYKRWPNPTPYNTKERIVSRIRVLMERRKRMIEKRQRRSDGTLTMAYQRVKLELNLLCSKMVIAYPSIRDRDEDNPMPLINALQYAAIRLQDGFYMPGTGTAESRAADKKEQLLSILLLSSHVTRNFIPSPTAVDDVELDLSLPRTDEVAMR